MMWSADRDGVQMTEEQVLTELHAAANAPIFGMGGSQLGRGVVGTLIGSDDGWIQLTTAVAVRILRGESPGDIRLATRRLTPEYDWHQLRR
jgi:hypothetical protein